MRTTITVDEDVLRAAKQLADSTGQTLGQAISSLARRGLDSAEPRKTRAGVTLLPVRAAATGATLQEVNRLRDEVP